MNKILIIIRREVLYRVSKTSFLVLTLIMPFLFAALIFVPLWLASIKNSEPMTVAVVDKTGQYVPAFRSNESYQFVCNNEMSSQLRSDSSEVAAVIYITGDLSRDSSQAVIYSRKEVPLDLTRYVNEVLGDQVQRERLAQLNIPNIDIVLKEGSKKFDVKTVKWNDNGNDAESSANAAVIVGFVFTFLIYMFIMVYGGIVMQSVMEEKMNRIVEIVVSSVKPFQLMMGKMIGVALTGIIQLVVWGIMLTILLVAAKFSFGIPLSLSSEMVSPMPVSVDNGMSYLVAMQQLPMAEILIMFVLFFIGGYWLYASFFAAVGSSINTHEDSSQFMTPVVIILVFGLYAAIYSVENPDGPLALWCSFIPLTSSIVMMVRIPFGVPLWQEILSLIILYVSGMLVTWIAGRIYRVGILMYGKKPSIKEIIKWINYD